MLNKPWYSINCLESAIQLSATLTGGQSFRWKKINALSENDITNDNDNSEKWIGVMGNCVWLLKQDKNNLFYKIINELPYADDSCFAKVRMKIDRPSEVTNKINADVLNRNESNNLLYPREYYERLLKVYFRLDIDLDALYKHWSKQHNHFRNKSNKFYGIRVLNQDPVENLFSFICSQNNNISRITTLVEKLCSNYGQKICTFNQMDYYTFPNVDALTKPEIESELRNALFGYRAKFIKQSALQIVEKGGLEWFAKLQDLNYKDAHAELISLTGIGPKVADCICLMSLNHLNAIPVDTHVYQIAIENYLPKSAKTKNITSKIYNEIGDKFREVYGSYAGWAQTVLFCSDLTKFNDKESADGVSNKRKRK